MQPNEPPGPAGRPNLLTTTRCSSDVQQQILARLEVKAAEKARMMHMARQSLRVAGMTAAGIGIVVAMLVVARHRALPAPAVIPVVVPGAVATEAALAPMPPLKVDDVHDQLGGDAFASLLEAGAEPMALAPPAPAVARIVPPRPALRRIVAPRPRVVAPARKPVVRRTLMATVKKPPKPDVATRAPAPVDTDVTLLSAILLHASRPAVVPPPFQRPACNARTAHLPALPCADTPPDP